MSIWAALRGFITTIRGWIAPAAKTLFTVAEKAKKLTTTVKKITDVYVAGKVLYEKFRPAPSPSEASGKPASHGGRSVSLAILEKSVTKYRAEIDDIRDHHLALVLHLEWIQLVAGSQIIERFENNMRLHRSNLAVHFESLRNVSGLLEFTERQNHGLRATIQQLNQVIWHLQQRQIVPRGRGVQQIRGIDLQPGEISILKQYEAFEQTVSMFGEECKGFSEWLNTQETAATAIRTRAIGLDSSASRSIIRWVDGKLLPKLKMARVATEDLANSVGQIPLLKVSAELRKIEDVASRRQL